MLITTIGNAAPVGICGSGLIDAIAIMLKTETIDETGYMTDAQKGFLIASNVSITGRDIRQFQLAKSAIMSGINILCKKSGLKPADIKNVFIAGGFGFFINKYNAINTGILPKEFINSIHICGNLSLKGAEENLMDQNFIQKCKKIISHCSVIDLSADPSFMDEFTDNMLFS